jgi:hypothetical protein
VISETAVGRAVIQWAAREHQKHWQSIPEQHAKGFLNDPSTMTTSELLKFNIVEIRQVIGLLTVHCHLREHFFKQREVNNPICRKCYMKQERPQASCVTASRWLTHGFVACAGIS